jgi:hypothetical protein
VPVNYCTNCPTLEDKLHAAETALATTRKLMAVHSEQTTALHNGDMEAVLAENATLRAENEWLNVHLNKALEEAGYLRPYWSIVAAPTEQDLGALDIPQLILSCDYGHDSSDFKLILERIAERAKARANENEA